MSLITRSRALSAIKAGTIFATVAALLSVSRACTPLEAPASPSEVAGIALMAFMAGVVFSLLKPLESRFAYGDLLRWVLAFALTAAGLLAGDLVAGKLTLGLYTALVLLMAICGLGWAAFMRGIKP